jgi:hypothetical protein
MATVTVIWATAAGAIITDGAADTAITMAGRAAAITITTESWQEAASAVSCIQPCRGASMPGLIGYMLAIVVTLGGYFAGLHWLISPPDPWQASAKNPAGTAQSFSARKRPPVVKPAEAAIESIVPAEPETRLANVETPTVETGENDAPRPVEPVVQAQRAAEVIRQPDAARPVVEPAHAARRPSATKTRPPSRKQVERNSGRKLELMVLRTYERSDGKRFTRLLPLKSARNAMAFQPDDQW